MNNMNKKLELIYNTAFDLIELRLNKKEGVVPFVVTLEQTENKPTVGMYKQSVGDTAKQLEIIRTNLRKKIENGEITTLCLCYDVYISDPRTKKKTDAVLIELADSSGESMVIYIPYNFSLEQIIQTPFQAPASQVYF